MSGPNYFYEILLFRNVSNAAQVKQACIDGKFKGGLPKGLDGAVALVKASLLFSPLELQVATTKAITAYLKKGDTSKEEKTGSYRMKTHTLDTEIVYYLSPTKSISDSLKQFGVGEDDKDLAAIIVVISQDKENDNLVRQEIENKKCALKNIICGTLEEKDLSTSLADCTNFDALKKIHKIQDKKMEPSLLAEIIVSRIATKDLN